MAKEIREIIAFQEQLAAGDPTKLACLDGLRNVVNYAEEKGALASSLPQFRDIPIADQLVAQAQEAWRVEVVPTPPVELLQTLERAYKTGFVGFRPILYRTVEFIQGSEFPGKGIKPRAWFWEQIKGGKIDPSTARLNEMWVLIDSTQKPNYRDGKQMYQGDGRLDTILRGLRKAGKIQVPEWCKGIPVDSRFGVSWNEINDFVIPEVASILDVARKRVGVPRAIEFNIAGNIYHPEWGDTSTWEWLADRFVHGHRLVGGSSDGGGLARVRYDDADGRNGDVGFRLQVAFPSKAA